MRALVCAACGRSNASVVSRPNGFGVAGWSASAVGAADSPAIGGTSVAASAPTHFTEDTPTAVLVRQVLGAIAEFDKTTLVAKLAAARRRKRKDTGRKVEGRKSHAEVRPELVVLVRQLRRRRPKGGQRSLRDISAELAQRGIVNERGQPFSAASINSMLGKL